MIAFLCTLTWYRFQHKDSSKLTWKNLICFEKLANNSIIVKRKVLALKKERKLLSIETDMVTNAFKDDQ
jgi:hypothetical protein